MCTRAVKGTWGVVISGVAGNKVAIEVAPASQVTTTATTLIGTRRIGGFKTCVRQQVLAAPASRCTEIKDDAAISQAVILEIGFQRDTSFQCGNDGTELISDR